MQRKAWKQTPYMATPLSKKRHFSIASYVNYHTFSSVHIKGELWVVMSLTFWLVLKRLNRNKAGSESSTWAPASRGEFRRAWSGRIWICVWARRGEEGEAGVLIISHSSPYSRPPCWEQSQQAPIYASTGRLHGNLRGSGVAGKGCFYLLMRSVPGAPCLSASVSQHLPCAVEGGGGGGSGGYECLPSDTNAIFTHLHPGPPSCAVQVRGMGGAARIRFCPVGKITNGSEIAVPQSGSSLSGKCSHAN